MGNIISNSAGFMHVAAGGGGGITDPDAIAYISAVTGGGDTLTSTEQTAIQDMIVGFKANGTWSKYIAIYGCFGNTASAHKWNLKNPLNTNAAFRLTYNGTATHAATGITNNGSSTYAIPHVTNFDLGTGAFATEIWIRTNVAGAIVDVGGKSTSGEDYQLDANFSGGFYGLACGSTITVSAVAGGGLHTVRYDGSKNHLHKNGTLLVSASSSYTVTNNASIGFYIGAFNEVGVANYFSNREWCFCAFSLGKTSAEVASDYTVIAAAQSALGR